uniref:hypothetical protein n=1 Tax=Salmonella enterica TaxID=28901 RepID=UPI00398C57E7
MRREEEEQKERKKKRRGEEGGKMEGEKRKGGVGMTGERGRRGGEKKGQEVDGRRCKKRVTGKESEKAKQDNTVKKGVKEKLDVRHE